jgi:ABC-2 type transport system permease protein
MVSEEALWVRWKMAIAAARLPADVVGKMAEGEQAEIKVYYAAESPRELSDAVTSLVGVVFDEVSNRLSEEPVNIQLSLQILGHNLMGDPLAIRDRLLPLLAVFMLMVETMGLAGLIAEERSTGTLRALFATPMKISDLFVGKGITGVGMTFTQALILMLVAGGLRWQPLLIIAALFLGAMLVTGIGFLLASTGKDFMGTIGWSCAGDDRPERSVFRGFVSGHDGGMDQVIPSYYLVDTVHQVVNYHVGWSEVWQNLAVTLVFSSGLLGLGAAF